MADCESSEYLTPMKILIILFHSTRNIGDLAILEATIARLKDNLEAPEFTLLANYPDEPYFDQKGIKVVPSPWAIVGKSNGRSLFHQLTYFLAGIFYALMTCLSLKFSDTLPSFVLGRWRVLFQSYLDAQIVIVSGGNQFYSSGRFGWPFPLNAMSLWLAHVFRKPVYTIPQSIGPLKRSWERWLIKILYRRNRMTFVRDKTTLRLAQDLIIPGVNYAPDFAFMQRTGDAHKARRILENRHVISERKNLGMTIIAPMGLALNRDLVNRYYDILAKIITKSVVELDYDVCIFRQVSGPSPVEDDGQANQLVVSKLEKTVMDRVHIIDGGYPPDIFESLYQHMDLFIASRLHSGIFAMCKNVPTVFIGYMSKTLGVLEALNLDQWCIEFAELDEKALWQLVNSMVNQRVEIQADIAGLMPEVFQQAEAVIPKIISDYNEVTRKNDNGKNS